MLEKGFSLSKPRPFFGVDVIAYLIEETSIAIKTQGFPASIRYHETVPLSDAKLIRMRPAVKASNFPILRHSINAIRNLSVDFYPKYLLLSQ
jgi:hypothetical protein